MMIWYEQSVTVPNQPPDATITLRGVYNSLGGGSTLPLIAIELNIMHNNEEITKAMYQHNPTMLRQEYPDPSDVLFKYQAKINKIFNRISNTSFKDL